MTYVYIENVTKKVYSKSVCILNRVMLHSYSCNHHYGCINNRSNEMYNVKGVTFMDENP